MFLENIHPMQSKLGYTFPLLSYLCAYFIFSRWSRKWAGHLVCMAGMRNACHFYSEDLENRILGRPVSSERVLT
jgi:hypothetical protein